MMILSRRKHTERQKDFMEKGIVKLFFCLFIFGCAGSSLLHMGFLCLVNRGYSLL